MKYAPQEEPQLPRRDMADPLLSFVLPVFNEVRVLSTLCALLVEAARRCGVRYEIIFVNDGSTDGSRRVLDQLAARHSTVKVVHLSRNFGHQAAIQAGLCHARGDAVVLMDSDLQDSPQAVPQFFAQWQAGYDVVYAVRTKRKEGALKRALFSGFYRVLSRLSHTPIPQDAGIFGLIDGRVARQIAALKERDRFFPGLRSWMGYRQIGVEVERLGRYDETPRVSMAGLFRLAKTAIFGFSSVPLAMFYVIGLTALAVFVGVAGFALFCRMFTDLAIPGWTSHVLSATFFGALNALGISILGEYVTRIYDEVRQRPLFLVEQTVNMDEPTLARSASEGSRPTRGASQGSPNTQLTVAAGSLPRSATLDDELEILAASLSAYIDADLDDEMHPSDPEVLDLLEEANALLAAASQHHSGPRLRTVEEEDCGAGILPETAQPARDKAGASATGIPSDPRD